MLPIVLSVVGSLLPSIVDSLRSGKSPEEAAQVIAPKRKELIDRLVGSGLAGQAAEAMADEAMKGELEKAQLPEALNPLIMTALSVAGMFGGMKAGNMIKASRAAKAAAGATEAAGAGTAGVAAATPKTPASAPSAEEVAMTGKTSDIRGMGASSPLPMSTDISNVGKASTIPPARGGMRAMSDPVSDIVPPRPVDTPFPPRDRFGGVTSELSPLPGPAQVPEWVRGAPNPAASAVDDMVAKGPFPATMHGSVTPSRLQPGLTDRDMQIEEIMKQMQMEEMRAARMATMPQAPPRSMRTVGEPLIPPWER